MLLAFVGRPTFGWAGQSAGDIQVTISNGPHGLHTIDGEFSVSASSQNVWDVLTDYDHMTTFVSSIKSSRTIRQTSESALIEQTMIGSAGFFQKRINVLLDVRENPFKEITFEDLSKRSFRSYKGTWKLTDLGNTVRVRYHLDSVPDFFAPDFIAAGAFKKNVMSLLKEVSAEIDRRSTTR